MLESFAKDNDGKIKFVEINLDEAPNTPGKFGIMSIPTLISFKEGKETGRYTGANKDKIQELVTAASG